MHADPARYAKKAKKDCAWVAKKDERCAAEECDAAVV